MADTETTTPVDKGSSPSSKASRGIDPSLVTTWVDYNIEPAKHDVIIAAAKARNLKVGAMLGNLLKAAIEAPDVWVKIEEDAASYTPSPVKAGKNPEDMNEEELERYIAKLERQQAALKKLSEKVKTIAPTSKVVKS